MEVWGLGVIYLAGLRSEKANKKWLLPEFRF